jgi:hypothetical protein
MQAKLKWMKPKVFELDSTLTASGVCSTGSNDQSTEGCGSGNYAAFDCHTGVSAGASCTTGQGDVAIIRRK